MPFARRNSREIHGRSAHPRGRSAEVMSESSPDRIRVVIVDDEAWRAASPRVAGWPRDIQIVAECANGFGP